MAHRRPELPDPPELSGVAGPRLRTAYRAAYRAAFHGRPADGAAVLRDCGMSSGGMPEGRWLMGVCLGALGHYRRAAGVLLPPGAGPDSLAASARASHLRQLGRHAEAEKLDVLAARLAPAAPDPDVARADALVGLVADAVGRADPVAAAARLVAAREHVTGLDSVTYWRAHVRLGWVAAEDAMLRGEPAAARALATGALARARSASAPRHRAKSLLVLGVAGHLLGRPDAARVLAAAAERAERLGVPTLVWPARLVLARALSSVDPAGSRSARVRADTVLRGIAGGLAPSDAERLLASQAEGPVNG